jgi:hypothetical protein
MTKLSNTKILTTQIGLNIDCPPKMRNPKLWERKTTHFDKWCADQLVGPEADGRPKHLLEP